MRIPLLLLASLLTACGARIDDSGVGGNHSASGGPTDAGSDPAPDSAAYADTHAGAEADAASSHAEDATPTDPTASCSVLGAWDMTARDAPCCGDDGSMPSFRFSADGTFQGGPEGTALDGSAPIQGTWVFPDTSVPTDSSTPLFGLTPSRGMGCTYAAQFTLTLTGCDELTLERVYDGCTGARWYIVQTTKFVRRR